MNNVTLSLVALATLGGAAQVQAADLTPEEQKAQAIQAKKAAIDEVRKVLNAASIEIEEKCPDFKDSFLLKLSNLTKELNDIYNDDEVLEFSEEKQAYYNGEILKVKKEAIDKQNLETAKATLDGISAVIFSASLGIGVMLSAAFVLVFQGAIVLLAQAVEPFLSDAVIAEMTCVGSLLIVAIGLNMLGVTKLKVMNFMPAVFLPILLCMFM